MQKYRFVMLFMTSVFLFNTSSYAESSEDYQRLEKIVIELQKTVKQLEKNLAEKAKNRDPEYIEVKVEDLEETVYELYERTGSQTLISSFDSMEFNLGGFLHTAYTHIDAEEGSASSFNRQNFELLVSATLAQDWTAFFAGGYLRESDDPFTTGTRYSPSFNTKNKNPLIIGWVNYKQSDSFNLRIGRMITPHGVINIEHFPATLYDAEQPQFLRPFSGNTIFPNFSTGIQAHGKHFLSSNHVLNYAAYVTNMSSAPEKEIVGSRLAWKFYRDYEIGLNMSNGYRPDIDDTYDMQGVDLLIKKSKYDLKLEYYETHAETGGDLTAYYIQPAWHMNPQWTLFYRHDILKGNISDGDSKENVIGVNYLPESNIRLRFIYTDKKFEEGFSGGTPLRDTDADIYQMSGTFSF